MKIYFAGSIRGGRDDAQLYMDIIEKLSFYGVVLTEHIGDKKISSYGQVHMTDEEIYKKDTDWIKEADIVVAEATTASLGVGYEIGFAEALHKPILILYREIEGKRLSAMIAGNARLVMSKYSTIDDINNILKEFFTDK